MKLFGRIIFVIFVAIQSSCGLLDGPAYKRPAVPEKSNWSNSNNEIAIAEVIRPDWWAEFNDDYLDQLVKRAIESNLDLQLLSSRLKLAGIQIGAEKTSKLPKISTTATSSFDLDIAGIKKDPAHNIGITLNWELDIWGKLEKGVDASKAAYLSTDALWRGGYLKLVSDVSGKYFEVRKLDHQTRVNQRSLEQLIGITNIYREQLTEGLVAEIKVMKQEAEIDGKEKDLLDLQRQRKLAENQLAILLGYPAGEFQVPISSSNEIKVPIVPAGLPADLLSRRPDVIAAEYNVLRAHFLVGKAQLARLPTISMTSQGGLVNDLISGALKTYTFGVGPTINIPIFDPSLGIRIDSSKENERSSILEYQNKVLRAFADVENSLINLNSRKAQEQKLKHQYDALKVVKDQIIEKLREGLVSQLEVLEAERSLNSNELALLNIQQQILSDSVNLYKALGGGWPVHVVAPSKLSEINEN
jgi:NodT family efflux transporter outer membrane factor (OMF) lipoprotein